VAYNFITLGHAESHVLYFFYIRFCLVVWFNQSLKYFFSFFPLVIKCL